MMKFIHFCHTATISKIWLVSLFVFAQDLTSSVASIICNGLCIVEFIKVTDQT